MDNGYTPLYPWDLLKNIGVTVQEWFVNAEDQQSAGIVRHPSFTRSPSFCVSETDGLRRKPQTDVAQSSDNLKSEQPKSSHAKKFLKPSVELQNQDAFLKDEYGLYRCLIIPDGNCLYRAMAQALTHDQSMYMVLRNDTVNHIQNHIEDFKPIIEGDAWDFLKQASKEGTWACYTEILALTQLYHINIAIITGGTAANPKVHVTLHHFNPNGGEITPKDTVWLSWLSNGHYDLVLDCEIYNPQYIDWLQERSKRMERDAKLAQQIASEDAQASGQGRLTQFCKDLVSNVTAKVCDVTAPTAPPARDAGQGSRPPAWNLDNDEQLAKSLQEEENEAFVDQYADQYA